MQQSPTNGMNRPFKIAGNFSALIVVSRKSYF